jgi:hypothetical protein
LRDCRAAIAAGSETLKVEALFPAQTRKTYPNTEYRIPNTEYRLQNTEYRLQNT